MSDCSLVTIRVVDSIALVDPLAWNACFPDELEDWGYYRATEQAGLPGFGYRYVLAMAEGRLVAAVPAFHTRYRLDTTVTGPLKPWLQRLTRWFPGVMVVPLAALGSPVAEVCALGFWPELPVDWRARVLARMVAAFEADAAVGGFRLWAVKDAPASQAALWREVLAARYQSVPGLPTAILPLTGLRTLEDYLATLSRSARRDLRRKLRVQDRVRIEYRSELDELLPQVMALYEQTRARSELSFETLTPEWLVGVLAAAGERGGCFLYWVGEHLVGFNLVLHDDRRMIDKFVGLDGLLGRQHHLYFISWLHNVTFCLAHGLACYQSGQADYGPKRRLGSRFLPNELWFRHASPFIHLGLRGVSRLLRLDRYDPELARLPGVSS